VPVRPTDDAGLLVLVTGVRPFVAALSFVVPDLDLPPGQRVWTASGLLVALLAPAVAAVDRPTGA
jgi:hypothetical protein